MRFLTRCFAVSCCFVFASAVFGQQGGTQRGAEDLNKEFIEKYFGLGDGDADVNLNIRRTVPETAVEPGKKPDGTAAETPGASGDSLSTLGKTLQIAIILLLGTLIYILSHRSRKRGGRF